MASRRGYDDDLSNSGRGSGRTSRRSFYDDDLGGRSAGTSQKQGGSDDLWGSDTGAKKVFNKNLLFFSLIFGIIAGLVALMIYDGMIEDIYGPLAIAVTMLVFYGILSLLVILYSAIRGTYTSSTGGSNMLVPVLIGFVGIFVLSFIFEFIYELGGRTENTEPTSYVFVIDDSGSMESNDPDLRRYEAIPEILEDMDEEFPYAVYSFSDQLYPQRELAPKGQNVQQFTTSEGYGGGTSIKGSLEAILELYRQGKLGSDKNPKVLLLSDGYAGDIGFFSSVKGLIKDYVKEGISISTVGLGSDVDESLMRKLAEGTGGVYLNVNDASDLKEAMEEAVNTYSVRNLFSVRIVPSLDFLYFIERVLFMGILGAGIGIMMIFAGGLSKSQDMVMVTSVIKGFLASFLLEILINMIQMSERLVSLIYFIIVALIFSTFLLKEKKSGNGHGRSNREERKHADAADDFGKKNRKKQVGPVKGFEDPL